MTEIFKSGGLPLGLIVLAGGESRRMGRNKALLPVGGETLIQFVLRQLEGRFAEILISSGSPDPFAFLGKRVIADPRPGQGPMMGIHTAISRSAYRKYFITACDVPVIELAFVRRLVKRAADFPLVLPTRDGITPEPLFGVYDRELLPAMETLLAAGERSLLPLLASSRTTLVPLVGDWYRNLNTLQDYEDFLRTLPHEP
jgi:molybdopterin-guanine dinucleotide biosynthesis protein A